MELYFQIYVAEYDEVSSKIQIRLGIQIIFFLFLHENICCSYSLEVPHRGTSNEYPRVFSWRYKKNINTFWLRKSPYQELYSL